MSLRDFDLSQATILNASGTYVAGTGIVGSSTTNVDFTFADYVLDPNTTYVFEISYSWTSGGALNAFLSSLPTTGDPAAAWSVANGFTFGYTSQAATPATAQITIGPGLQQWADAMTADEKRMVIGAQPSATISAFSLISQDPPPAAPPSESWGAVPF